MTIQASNKDGLVKDIQEIVREELGAPEDYDPLIQRLLIYIVNRDGRVKRSGYRLGEKHAKENS